MMPRPAAIDFRSEKSLSTDEISLLGASLGGPEDPATEKREFIRNGGRIIGGGGGKYAECMLQLHKIEIYIKVLLLQQFIMIAADNKLHKISFGINNYPVTSNKTISW